MKNRNTKQQLPGGSYYMYGKHAVFAALSNPRRQIKKIHCLAKFADQHQKELQKFDVEIVDNDFFNRKIGQDQAHQGICALVNPIYLDHIDAFDFHDKCDRIAILDQITDPQNIGAIIRSAAAFGITKLILPSDHAPDENASVAKAACGCLELVQIVKIPNLKTAIDKLKKKGFWAAGLDASGKDTPESIAKTDKLIIIIGSEDKGMRRLTLESCDFLVGIPIAQNVESLNASVSASIVFYLSVK